MKHIKTFEKNNDTFWYYAKINSSTPKIDEILIFNDKESAENYYINEVNDIAMYSSDSNVNQIFTLSDAESYVYDNESYVEINQVRNIGKFDLSEELKIGRDMKKYNL